MEPSPGPWISALRHSHGRLQAGVEPLGLAQLERRSYASEWSIAQVLSHLGSQAEIFGLFLDAGLTGQDPPGREEFAPIWDSWNAKDPQAQASDALRADEATLERFESLDADGQARLHLKVFGMELGATGLARMRVGEHAIHTWDVLVALDPSATVAPDAVALLIDTLDQLAARAGKPDGKRRRVRVSTTDPDRQFILETGEAVTLTPSDGEVTAEPRDSEQGLSELRLPAEAFVRLVYGRMNAAHTPPAEVAGVDLDELRQIFPGFLSIAPRRRAGSRRAAPDDDGDVQVGRAGHPRGQAAGGEGRIGPRGLALAGLDEQVPAGRQPPRRTGGDAAQHGEAVRTAVEGRPRLVLPGFGREEADLPGGHVGHVGGQHRDPAPQRGGQRLVQVTLVDVASR
jgi:uncharacterized protein (TIGR03083 family)